jgi:hypothetical protein
MKNEVKKKMMMREHRSAVRKSPKRDVGLENQHRHSSFPITETFSSPSSATHSSNACVALSRFRKLYNAVRHRRDVSAQVQHFPARTSIMNIAKCSLELDSWPLSTMLSSFPDAAHP